MVDFRSNPSSSPEGAGLARRAWDSYAAQVRKATPILMPALRPLAVTMTSDLLGFWVSWHLHGGFEGLVELGAHPTTVWRRVKRFRTVFGQHPDEFKLAGVTIDPEAYWEAARKATEARTAAAAIEQE